MAYPNPNYNTFQGGPQEPPPQQQWQSQPPSGYQQQPPQQQTPYPQPPGQSYQQQQTPYPQPPTQNYQPPAQPTAYPQLAPGQSYQPQAQPGQAWQPGQPTDGDPSYQWDNVPTEDAEDNENMKAPAPSAPPPDSNEGYHEGDYANVNFNDSAPVPPPTYEEAVQVSERPPEEFAVAATLSEEEIQDAMIQYVSENCCYGSKPAKEMTINQIQPSSALHYQLETFSESRITKREFEPHIGKVVDGPMFGQPPPVWAIECYPNNMFSDHTKQIRVPHTEHVSGCHVCSSRGFTRCWRCHGRGRIRCGHCHGSGRVTHHREGRMETRPCHSCFHGRKRCYTCTGDGRIICVTCKGFRALLHFIKLSVVFKNHISDYILERSDLPDQLIRGVSGREIFSQEGLAVWPVASYPVPEICSNSQNIVNMHRQTYQNEKQLRQKHWLRSVPVSEVHFKYKDTNGRFWVYGFEKKVHAPDYPAQCCWGCNVL